MLISNVKIASFLFNTYSYGMNILNFLLELAPQFFRKLYFSLIFKKFGHGSTIDYGTFTRYPWKVSIGHNVVINRGCEFYSSMQSEHGYIEIEDNVALGPKVIIFSAGHDHTSLDLPDISSPVIIKKRAWIGGNTTILPGVTIGEGAIVGAGSVVTKSLPSYTISVGNPAKVIKERVITNKKI